MSPRMTVAAVLIAGMTAGFVVSPVFIVATLVVAVFLVNGFQHPDGPAPVTTEWAAFSPNVGRRLAASLTSLSDDAARRSLLEIGVRARSLMGSTANALDDSHEQATREHVEHLVVACCDSAIELSQIEEALAADVTAAATAKFDGPTRDRLIAARSLLDTRLMNAADVLKQLYAADLTRTSTASERVAELTSELTEDAAVRRAALAELSDLLGR